MDVKLIHHTPLSIAVSAARNCYGVEAEYEEPTDTITEKDIKLLQTIKAKGHHSVLEHLNYSFVIKGISRLCLQELVRHRHASYSVKSTRYTLKELKKEESFVGKDYREDKISGEKYIVLIGNSKRAEKYIVLTGNSTIDKNNLYSLEILRDSVLNAKNDIAKYSLPECYKTDVYMTINASSLINFFEKRMASSAHFEIEELAHNFLDNITNEHLFLYI